MDQWEDNDDSDQEVNGIIDLSGNNHQQQLNQQGGQDDVYSDDGSSDASIPPEHIDFSLTYAL